MGRRPVALGLTSLVAAVAVSMLVGKTAPAQCRPLRLAQLGLNPGSGPDYGHQPYNDRNLTGFYTRAAWHSALTT